MKRLLTVLLITCCAPTLAAAHHGVASLGVAGLEGPGAPVESSSSATLPAGQWLASLKLDYAVFDAVTPERDDEGDRSAFWIYGVGRGLTPSLSLHLFMPYSVKKLQDNSYNSAGFADISLLAVFGLKWDRGLRAVPAGESLDDLEDWHFTLYGGGTLPTGDADLADRDGAIDPGQSPGFGEPSFLAGATATKTLGARLTLVVDGSWIGFQEHEYADGQRLRFGTEWRWNTALTARVLTDGGRRFRLDANLEANALSLGRDRADGVDEFATGGRMLYLLPGVRAYFGNSSLGLGWKVPLWTDLNESADQQGAEGTETGRLIATWSTLF